ncbi:Translation initiation factor IF-3 [Neolecta irregularis DAH-3]|uniref:Translation initiation factor IF-3 n=1 Tax=Neolecta irregularis (strain DAH-3) TaxID=1198029 RepID=A0A1U7LTN8_NEOID|nr:Translation initiation factor IF-3 [Neolecta irregularis DAH-3]|eukprot:OLL25978.1 Translation initiation factor IF-3 [Neolecta irregularis DAH-3]
MPRLSRVCLLQCPPARLLQFSPARLLPIVVRPASADSAPESAQHRPAPVSQYRDQPRDQHSDQPRSPRDQHSDQPRDQRPDQPRSPRDQHRDQPRSPRDHASSEHPPPDRASHFAGRPQYRSSILRFMPSVKPPRPKLSNKLPQDAYIKAPFINLVDLDGKLHPRHKRASVLYDPALYTLVCLTPGTDVPTCKLIAKDQLAHIHEEKSVERLKLRRNINNSIKEFNLTWTISEMDIKHKIAGAINHLEKGGVVQVHFENKKRKNATDSQYRQNLLTRVENILKDHGKEWRSQIGTVRSTVVIYYKGNVQPVEDLIE